MSDERAKVKVQQEKQQTSNLEVPMLFEGKNVRIANHCFKQIAAKGFDPEKVRKAIVDPEKVTEVRKHPGQLRACGWGYAVVLAPHNHGREWMAVTVYLDGVVTPLRPDQKNDPAALASARVARAEKSA